MRVREEDARTGAETPGTHFEGGGGAPSQGGQVPQEAGKDKGTESLPEPQREGALPHLHLNPVSPVLDSDLQTVSTHMWF